jgi:hypothetical protein
MTVELSFVPELPRKGGALRQEASAEMMAIRDACVAHEGQWAMIAERVPTPTRWLPLRKLGIEVRSRAIDTEMVIIEEVRLESGGIVNRARAATPKEIAAKSAKERVLYNVWVGYKPRVAVEKPATDGGASA